MPGRDEGNRIRRRGWPVTIRATLPASADLAPEPRRAQQAASQYERKEVPVTVGVATLSAASTVLALPQPAAATVSIKCCNLCVRKYRCIEHNRYISNCTSSCTGVRCSRIRDIGSC